jgi:catechol 2,3-dioxygenase-like lactoylglutathione lyase family enzyme
VVNVTHILETAIYVADLAKSRYFYQRLFDFTMFLQDDRMIALGTPGRQVLLLFRIGSTEHPAPTPFGTIPPHGATGPQHIAFGIPREQIDDWTERLADQGVAIESRLEWPSGSIALYFRDPDGHSLELATPGLWPNYPRG